eukprot:scaffold26437_cov120-Isochrysis_galbana.AAC.3
MGAREIRSWQSRNIKGVHARAASASATRFRGLQHDALQLKLHAARAMRHIAPHLREDQRAVALLEERRQHLGKLGRLGRCEEGGGRQTQRAERRVRLAGQVNVEVRHRFDVFKHRLFGALVAKVALAPQGVRHLRQLIAVVALQQQWMLRRLAKLGEGGCDP